MIAINGLAELVMEIAGKNLKTINIPGPLGVKGRKSDNRLIFQKLGWKPSLPLKAGMKITYAWIAEEISKQRFALHTAKKLTR